MAPNASDQVRQLRASQVASNELVEKLKSRVERLEAARSRDRRRDTVAVAAGGAAGATCALLVHALAGLV